jgi:prepilin-type N-terminal cleavage/methylation domain-containing protein
MNKNRLRQRGFSLMELLLVISIIAVMTSLSVVGMKSLVGDRGLTGAGNQMSAILAFARQEAISKNTDVAVVILTSTNANAGQYRTLSVWEFVTPADGSTPTSSNWIQASKWQTLPTGIVIDSSSTIDANLGPTATASSFVLQSSTVSPALPTMSYLGGSVNPATDCAVQVFLPSGRLISSAPNPCTLTLVEGSSHPAALPSNYVTYYFSTATGETKVVRP